MTEGVNRTTADLAELTGLEARIYARVEAIMAEYVGKVITPDRRQSIVAQLVDDEDLSDRVDAFRARAAEALVDALVRKYLSRYLAGSPARETGDEVDA